MRGMALWTLLAGVVAFGACSDDETDPGTTTTGTTTGTASGGGGQGGGGGASPYPECAAVDGICTDARWELCPNGTEPVDPNPNRDCPGGEGAQGWCCVDAPPSTCSDDSSGNCIVGDSCEGCWAEVQGYDCEDGRVCCEDICF